MDDSAINDVNIPYEFPMLSDEDKQLSWKHPAMESRGRFYLIQDNKVIGKVKMASALGFMNGTYSDVTIEPDDQATKEFFKDDFTLEKFNMVLGLRYDGITGRPMQNFDDEPVNRHKGTEIVDEVNFDFGICHPRFKSVEGWAAVRNKRPPSVHVKQKHRRPRNSNKIKKVA